MDDLALVAAGRSSPGLRYRNVDAAIEWLRDAFGFELHSVKADASGRTTYAELSFGSTIIMVGAVSGFEIDRFMKQPDDVGGAETQCCYYVVDDLDAHYVRARRAGAKVVIDLQTRPDGTRAFTCRDPEGHLWCFGTYDPWHSVSPVRVAPRPAPAVLTEVPAETILAPETAAARFPARLAAGLSMGAIVSAIVVGWAYTEAWQSSRQADAAPAPLTGPERVIGSQFGNELFQRAIKDVRLRLALERRSRRAAERASKAALAEAARERSLRIAAEQTAKDLAGQLAQARQAVATAQSAASAAQDSLAKERARTPQDQARLAREVEAAQQAAAEAHAALSREQQARVAAEQVAKATRVRLTFVSHSARQGSEEAIAELRTQMSREKAAREAAELEARRARDEIARERSMKMAALRNAEIFRRRLAQVGGVPLSSLQTPTKAAPVARKRVKAAQPKPAPATSPQVTKTAEGGWSLSSGPVFAKGGGSP